MGSKILLCYIITKILIDRVSPASGCFLLPSRHLARVARVSHTHEASHARNAPLSRSDTVDAQLGVAETLCEQRGRRLTPIRRKVLELLLRHGRSLKAYELLDAMRAVHPGAAPPTVYRALDFLMDEGLIHRLDAVNAWSACHDAGGAPHDLLVVCTGCGAVAEVSDPAMSRQLAERVAQTGYALATHETEIRALCPQCQKSSPPRPPATITTSTESRRRASLHPCGLMLLA